MNDVFLITIDSLRYDRCGFSGYRDDTTPTIDQLASENAVFSNAYSPGPRTAESIPGIISSRLSCECSFVKEPSYSAIPQSSETLATWLGDQGYETISVLANPQLSPERNFDLGFETFQNLKISVDGDQFKEDDNEIQLSSKVIEKTRTVLQEVGDLPLGNPTRPAYVAYRLKQLSDWPTIDGAEVINELISELEGTNDPVFAWTHLNDLHTPLHPGRVREGGLIDNSNIRQFWDDSKRVEQEFAPGYERAYDSMLRYVDNQVGKLVSYLKKSGRWEEAVIIITADHGESMHDRGFYGHHAGAYQRLCYDDRDYLHQDLLHVPLVVKTSENHGERITHPFSLCWLHELIADANQLPRGNFRYTSGSNSETPPTRPVIADTFTNRGHTAVVRNDKGTIYTDDKMDNEKWWYIRSTDEGERIHHPVSEAPNELLGECESIKTPLSEMKELEAKMDSQTQNQLQDLGYL